MHSQPHKREPIVIRIHKRHMEPNVYIQTRLPKVVKMVVA